MDATTSEILRVIVGAGLGTAFVQGGVAIYQHWVTRRNQAAFLAFRVAIQLEGYARTCVGRIYDADNYVSSRGAIGNPLTDLPDAPEYPEDADGWRSVDPQIMDYAYRLLANIESVRGGLRFLWTELSDEDAAFTEAIAGCASTGLEAKRTATSIRQYYGFAALDDDIVEMLQSSLKKAQKPYSYRWYEERD